VEIEAKEDSDSMSVTYEQDLNGEQAAPVEVEVEVKVEPETKQMMNGLYAGMVLAVSTLLMAVYFMVSGNGGGVAE